MFEDEDAALKFLFIIVGIALAILILAMCFQFFMVVYCTFFSECRFIK